MNTSKLFCNTSYNAAISVCENLLFILPRFSPDFKFLAAKALIAAELSETFTVLFNETKIILEKPEELKLNNFVYTSDDYILLFKVLQADVSYTWEPPLASKEKNHWAGLEVGDYG